MPTFATFSPGFPNNATATVLHVLGPQKVGPRMPHRLPLPNQPLCCAIINYFLQDMVLENAAKGTLSIKTTDEKYQNKIGRAPDASFLDVKLANLMYNCDGKLHITCQNISI